MRRPGFGEVNLGGVLGLLVGALGGLFAISLPRAIQAGDPAALLVTPILNLICCLLCGAIGWFLGGQIGPRVGQHYQNPRAEMIAGGLVGFLAVGAFTFMGWYFLRS